MSTPPGSASTAGPADPGASRAVLPPLPADAVLATIGRFATRYPDSAWLDLLALRASGGRSDAAGLVARSREGDLEGTDPRDLAWFGFVLAAELGDLADLGDVADLLGHALAARPTVAPRVRGLWLQALVLTGRLEAGTAGPAEDEVEPEQWWAASTDLLSPFRRAAADPAPWLESLSRPFTDRGLVPLRLDEGTATPFDRLTTAPVPPVDGDLVSVVMPVHNPSPSLLTSVRSVLAQSWTNLEVLLCDDASTTGRDLIEEAAALDPRVRVLRSPENGGAYTARNTGLAQATGRWLTFQDADDWSHPQRVERQVEVLTGGEGVVATVGHAVRATDRLQVTSLGLNIVALTLPTLLLDRGAVLGALGGYDPVRRSADREFLLRLQAAFGPGSTVTTPGPLAVYQMTPGSLSRGDMGLLRRHAARQAYATAAGAWHRAVETGAEAPLLRPPARAPFPAPQYIAAGTASTDAGTVDVVLLGNPAANAATDVEPVAEALCGAGLRVGVVEFVGPHDACRQPGLPGDELAGLFRSGRARWVLPGEHVRARVAMVHDPLAVLTMPPGRLREVHVDHLVLVADRVGELDAEVAARAAHAAAGGVHWLPAAPGVAAHLADAVPGADVLDPAPWLVHRGGSGRASPLSDRPVVGLTPGEFADRDARARWDRTFVPQDEATSLLGYGRLPGRRAGRELSRVGPPDVAWPDFLDRVDYLLAAPLSEPRLTPAVLDAVARGVVVLASDELRPHLGAAADYLDGTDVDTHLARHRAEPHRYAAAQQRAADWRRRYATSEGLRATWTALVGQLDAR
jgi:hypothetical protein